MKKEKGEMPAPGTIVLENVHKRYQRGDMQLHRSLTRWARGLPPPDAFWALLGVTATIRPGETVGLIGPNAAGKSTLLKIIAGITAATSGSVRAHGRVGSLIELGAGFHPELSGRENVMLLGTLLGLSRGELQERLPSITEFADIGPFFDAPVKRYSSGMEARLGFAIAVSVEPNILLIDEALSVGDVWFQEKCFARINTFRDAGVTIMLVSHMPEMIFRTCARTIWVEEGRILADGQTREILAAYGAAVATAVPVPAARDTA